MKKLFNALLTLIAICAISILCLSAEKIVAETTGEITELNDRITIVDASYQLPYNYASVIGFELTFTLETDQTNYVDGYGGVGEDPTKADYNMHFPCYMLIAIKGYHDDKDYNENTFGCAENENYEHYMEGYESLYDQEIVKIGVGEGYYVAGYLDHGKAFKEGKNAKAGSQVTITYQGTSALFTQGSPYMTFYGYTAEFRIDSIKWITGTPVITVEEDWDIVEKTAYNDIETVENSADQNGSNYINIIEPKTGDGPFPVVLWIHGGAWSTSSRTDIILNTTMEYFLSKGYAFVSVEYTLSKTDGELSAEEKAYLETLDEATAKSMESIMKVRNDSQGRQMMYDIKLAVRYLRAHGSDYNLDTRFICAMGESAGAHLSLLMSTTNGIAEYEGENGDKFGGYDDYSSDVECAVSYSLPSDASLDSASFLQDYTDKYPLIASLSKEAMESSNTMLAYYLLGYDFVTSHTVNGVQDSELVEATKFMSPYWQVDSNTPPMYIIHGEADGAVGIYQAYAMELMAKTFMEENDVKTAYYPEAGHVDKAYFDVYTQYVSTQEFVEETRSAYIESLNKKEDPSQDPIKDPEGNKTTAEKPSNGETKKGCKSEIALGSGILFLIAIPMIALKKKKED